MIETALVKFLGPNLMGIFLASLMGLIVLAGICLFFCILEFISRNRDR